MFLLAVYQFKDEAKIPMKATWFNDKVLECNEPA
jgi:hypothetical protein